MSFVCVTLYKFYNPSESTRFSSEFRFTTFSCLNPQPVLIGLVEYGSNIGTLQNLCFLSLIGEGRGTEEKEDTFVPSFHPHLHHPSPVPILPTF